jgi:hypothetical protein
MSHGWVNVSNPSVSFFYHIVIFGGTFDGVSTNIIGKVARNIFIEEDNYGEEPLKRAY